MNTIKLPANHSFTLWTTPAALAPKASSPAAPVSTKLRLPGQPFTLWTQPGRVERIAMRNPAAPASTKAAPVSREAVSSSQRWLPLAAGLAVAALFGMMYFLQKDRRQKTEENYVLLEKQSAAEISTAQVLAKEATTKAEDALSKLTAREKDLNDEIANLKTALTKSAKAAETANDRVTTTTAVLDKAKKDLADTKKEFADKETELQTSMTSLTEETGKVKRLAGEEAGKAREAIAKLEEEKAAAVKDAAAAMADRDALKVEVEKLRKQLQSPAKPPGTPEA